MMSEVAGVLTQGRDKRGAQAWVTHYFVSYSEDAYRWDWARDIYGVKKVGMDWLAVTVCPQLFSGNSDSHSVRVSYLEHPVTARFLILLQLLHPLLLLLSPAGS